MPYVSDVKACSLVKLISDHADSQPEALAAVWQNQTLTYGQLESQSLDLALVLHSKGVRRGGRVVVVTARCLDMLVFFYAVLKVGACYVPIDVKSLSKNRIRQVIESVKPTLVLASTLDIQWTSPTLLWTRENGFLDVNTVQKLKTLLPSDFEEHRPEDLVYIIFTSGTTSKPKGVMIPHRALVNYVQQGDITAPFNLGATSLDRVLLIFSPAFDACTGVIFSTLCNGGTLVVADTDDLHLRLPECTILACTPSILRSIDASRPYSLLRAIFLGGESPAKDLISSWSALGRKIYNCYGPTETTCTSLIAEISANEEIVLGLPMQHSSIILLDETGKPNDQGEICISGPGLAVGYLDDEALTHAKFFFYNGTRFYKTGDFAKRINEDLIFLGRADNIVKNRGFLINLDQEVIPALCLQEGVEGATAIKSNGRLVAFVTPGTCQPQKIRLNMAKTCDTFLVPEKVFPMDKLPINSNGKLDIQSLHRIAEDVPDFRQSTMDQAPTNLEILKSVVAESLGLNIETLNMKESFWALGGSSLAAIQVLSKLRLYRLSIPLSNLLDQETSMEFLNSSIVQLQNLVSATLHAPRRDFTPLSFTQERILKAFSKSPYYNYMVVSIEFAMAVTDFKHSILEQAFNILYERHSILSASFDLIDHVIQKPDSFQVDWRCVDTTREDFDAECKRQINYMSSCMEISNSSNPRTVFRLVTAVGRNSTLLWLIHHARVDGYSMKILLEELRTIVDGRSLPKVPQFSEAAVVMRHIEENSGVNAENFWKRKMDIQSRSRLLEISHNSTTSNIFGDDCELSIHLGLTTSSLQDICRKLKLAPSTIFYAAWAILLCNYTGSRAASFGAVFSGRNLPMNGAESIVGPMINVCPFAIEVCDHQGILCWLHSIQIQINQTGDMQWSLDRFTSQDNREGSSFLYDTLVSMQYDISDSKGNCEAIPTPWKVDHKQVSEFSWTLVIATHDDDFEARLLYQPSPTARRIATRALSHFKRIVSALLDTKHEKPIIELASEFQFDQHELDQLLQKDRTPALLPTGHCSIKTMFEGAANEFADVIALSSTSQSMTYKELNISANTLAWALLAHRSAGDLVAILGDGSIEWCIGIIACIKIGSVYCVIDISLPKDRAERMLELSQATILITPNHQYTKFIKTPSTCKIFCVEEIMKFQECSYDSPPFHITLDSPAYLIFTSGTTGTPKGVVATNRGLLSYISYPPARLHAAPGRKIAQMFSVGFDACMAEIFGTLCYGGTILLKNPNDIFAHLRSADAAMMTPSFLSACDPKDLPNLDTILLGGEVVPQHVADTWSVGRRLYNGYGPCECTVGSVFSQLSLGSSVTLGRPISGMRAYILNENLKLLPIGLVGEIYLSGIQVIGGYYICEPKDNERFIPDPWYEGEVMFRTGDRGRWTEGMEIEYMGRLDRQIKLRGFRINLEEVESVIRQASPSTKQVAVLALGQNLVAISSRPLLDKEMKNIRSLLPHYSIPSRFIVLEDLPLTTNQKIDYRILEKLASETNNNTKFSLPETEMARSLAQVWKEVLGRRDFSVGNSDNFVSLGGHSILQIQLARRLEELFQMKIPLDLITSNLLLSEQAESLQALIKTEAPKVPICSSFLSWEISKISPQSTVSTVEEEIVFLSSKSKFKSAFNMSYLLQIIGPLDINYLTSALHQIMLNSRVLRTRYSRDGKQLVRHISSSRSSLLEIQTGPTPQGGDLQMIMNKPFDFASDQLLKLTLYRENSINHTLLLLTHHSIMDGSSLNIFFRSLQAFYAKEKQLSQLPTSTKGEVLMMSPGREDNLKQKPDFIDWLNWKAATTPSYSQLHSNFWSTYLHNRPLPLLKPCSVLNNKSNHQNFTLSAQLTCTLISLCGQYSLTLQQIILACLLLTLHTIYKATDLILAIPFLDRTTPGTENLLGNFLDRLPIRLHLSPYLSSPFSTLLTAVKASVEQAIEHVLPYNRILSTINLDPDPAAEEHLFEIIVSYRSRDSVANLEIEGCEVTECRRRFRAEGAMFPVMFEFWQSGENGEGNIECEIVFMVERVTVQEIELLVKRFVGVVQMLAAGVERNICEDKGWEEKGTRKEISVAELLFCTD